MECLKTRLRFKVSVCIDGFARDIDNIFRLVTAYYSECRKFVFEITWGTRARETPNGIRVTCALIFVGFMGAWELTLHLVLWRNCCTATWSIHGAWIYKLPVM